LRALEKADKIFIMADIKYSSKVKELVDATYFLTDPSPEEREVQIKILDHYIDEE